MPPLTPVEEASHRAQQAQTQEKDAIERKVVWDVEHGLGDIDAEGEDDPDYIDVVGGKFNDSGVDFAMPLGIRNEEGTIVPLASTKEGMRLDTAMDVDGAPQEALFLGLIEVAPSRAGALVCRLLTPLAMINHKSVSEIDRHRHGRTYANSAH